MDQHTDTDTSSNMTKIQEERLRELLYRAHREARQRLTYFLLAADGAAIAYALTQTQSAKIAWSQIPLAIAVISWGLSFYCGLRHLRYVNRNLFANFNLIELESSKHAESNDILQFTNNLLSQETRKIMEEISKKTFTFGIWHYRFLILGAISYIIWHVLEMYLRTITPH